MAFLLPAGNNEATTYVNLLFEKIVDHTLMSLIIHTLFG